MVKQKIKAEKIEAVHLRFGDLYSYQDEDFWETAGGEFGEQVFIRLNGSLPDDLKDKTVYKLSVSGQKFEPKPGVRFRLDPHVPPGVKGEFR